MATLDQTWRDLNYAVRVLRKRPAFTLTSVVTLALCIGANTAIFSVVDSVLLRSLPYPNPDQLAAWPDTSEGVGAKQLRTAKTDAPGSPYGTVHRMSMPLWTLGVGWECAGFRSMADVQFRALAFQHLQATLLTMLAGLALVLAAVGIYGLIASSVVQRTRELGIRLALGATSSHAMRSVVAPGLALTLIGIVIGVILARVLVRVMQHVIFGVAPGDPLTFVTVAGMLLIVAGVASAIPALRVLRLDPAQTLRHD